MILAPILSALRQACGVGLLAARERRKAARCSDVSVQKILTDCCNGANGAPAMQASTGHSDATTGSTAPALARLQRNKHLPLSLCYELAGSKTLESSAWRAGPNQDLGRDEPRLRCPRWSNQDFVMPTVHSVPLPPSAPQTGVRMTCWVHIKHLLDKGGSKGYKKLFWGRRRRAQGGYEGRPQVHGLLGSALPLPEG